MNLEPWPAAKESRAQTEITAPKAKQGQMRAGWNAYGSNPLQATFAQNSKRRWSATQDKENNFLLKRSFYELSLFSAGPEELPKRRIDGKRTVESARYVGRVGFVTYHLELFTDDERPMCQFKHRFIGEHIVLTESDFAAKRKTDSILCCRRCKRLHVAEERIKES